MIPEGDLAHIKYENLGYCAKETILLVSTPRSGSTMLCTDIDVKDGGPMAEYCQPYQIIPYLMQNRPEIKSGEELSLPRYANYLKNFRSGRAEKLCINIHASHTEIYNHLQPFLPPVTRKFLLLRKDIVKQAISYYISSATGNWSSSYGRANETLKFNPTEITNKIVAIFQGVKKNIEIHSTSTEVIFYKDYVDNKTSFAKVNNIRRSQSREIRTQRQATNLNNIFNRDYIEYIEKNKNENIINLIESYSNLLGKFNAD